MTNLGMKTALDYKETLTRQQDLIPLDVLGASIKIIGAGAVGSWTTLALAKMGFLNLFVQDMDDIDIENMNCQFFPVSGIGFNKAEVLAKMVKDFTTKDITVATEPYDGERIYQDIIISAVDNMKVRQSIFENTQRGIIIDPRMSAEKMLLYVVDASSSKEREAYAKSLYSDEDAMFERCTAKSTIYCANILAGLVAKAVKNIACKQGYTKFMSVDLVLNDFNAFTQER